VLAQTTGLEYNPTLRGFDGPINVTQPDYVYKSTRDLIAAEKKLGITQIADQATGNPLGGFWFGSTQSPGTHERSYVVNGHLESTGARRRENLHLIAGWTVTKVVFEGKRAAAVEFADRK